MARFRIYANKTNNILSRYPTINTGSNPVSELWYGKDGISRLLIQYDVANYLEKYDAGYAPHFSAATDILISLKNPGPSVETISNTINRAQSYDIIMHPMTTEWDTGTGFDFVGLDTADGYSNWNSATTIQAFTTPGGDFDDTITVATQHFDLGSEDFNVSGSSVDTDNLWDQFTGTNYGFILKYTDGHEALSATNKTITQQYTEDTNTLHLPFIEVEWDDQITEDREGFRPGEKMRLYAILKNNDMLLNAYSANSVNVSSSYQDYTTNIPGSKIRNPRPGVYYVDFSLPSHPIGTIYTDAWSFDLDGLDDEIIFSQSLTSSTSNTEWEIEEFFNPKNYIITTPKLKDVYFKGDVVYLPILIREPYSYSNEHIKRMEYRIVLTGRDIDEFIMSDWQPVSYNHLSNFFIMDTSWFIDSCEYRVEFKYYDAGSYVYYKPDQSTFKVLA
jgi:hypothetical protein